MASFNRAFVRVKQDLDRYLPPAMIESAAKAAKHHWRKRLLDPVITVQLFVLQVLNFNTSLTHLKYLAGQIFKPSAFCQARARLPLKMMRTLLRSMCDAAGATGLFHGHKLWIVDGTSASLADTKPLQKDYPQPKTQRAGCGFPLMKVLGLFDAATGMLIDMVSTSLHAHEQSHVWQLHPRLSPGDIVLGDRGFCSFWHFAMLWERKVQGLFRIHQRQIVDFRPHRKQRQKGQTGRPTSRWIKRLGKHDQLVALVKPKTKPTWMTPAIYASLPAELIVRELRYTLTCRGQRTRTVTIATTLLDPLKYPRDEIVFLYGVRWEIETHFRQLKTTMKMRVLKCKSTDGVNKELLAFALAYNLVRLTMNEAAKRQQVDIERISFIDTLRWLISAEPGQEMPDLLTNPLRPDRIEPRVIKRRAKQYDLMNRPRKELRQRLMEKKVAA